MTVVSTMTLTQGTLNSNSKDIVVNAGWNNINGFFTANASSVTFTSSSPQTITSHGSPFNNIVLNGASGGSWVLIDSMTVASSITLNSATLNSNSKDIAVAGSWIN